MFSFARSSTNLPFLRCLVQVENSQLHVDDSQPIVHTRWAKLPPAAILHRYKHHVQNQTCAEHADPLRAIGIDNESGELTAERLC